MKSVQLIALVALAAITLSFSVSTGKSNHPLKTYKGEEKGLVWKNEEIDLGSIPKGKPVTVQFEFSNKGKELVIIENVTTSCGCTVADFPQKPIKKNEKASISVTYNAANAGAFTKAITVTIAKGENKILHIKGTVI